MSRLTTAIATASALGLGALVLQRWIASTRTAAIALVLAWFALVALVGLAVTLKRPQLRLPVLGTVAAVALATVAVGYWTGFRDREVDEDVIVAAEPASTKERSGERQPSGPVSLATGSFSGADGHAGMGAAEIVQSPDGARTLTFTEFDVDPGIDVQVYLTPDTQGVDDGVELGGLKGNVGDQQYAIPESADLGRFDSVVLWCTPFTVRIAIAELRA